MIKLNNQIKVIQKKDSDFPEHLDFEVLRQEGLLHIGELSGKIWTDHNIHDPGVTILEMLCYALMDLGYRSQLSVPDLMAQKPTQDEPIEDNFVSPAQILTNNPISILDFRKMLMDIPDIRNAWLEIGTAEPVELYLQKTENSDGIEACELLCRSTSSSDTTSGEEYIVHLNGLYKVYLELEKAIQIPDNPSDGLTEEEIAAIAKEEQRREDIIQIVKTRLNQHRNLCEDFIDDICILKQDKIGVCGTIMLHETAKPEDVYLKIIQKIRQFLSPKINYYSLEEMLDKGKSIEQIYEGRPYSSESFGFLDTDELEQIPRRTEIHQSDIYRLILSVEGVVSVTQLQLNINGNQTEENTDWILPLSEDHLPVFCLENSYFNLYKGNIWLRFDQQAVLQKEINTFKRIRLSEADLDAAIPQGVYRADLGDYYSIQNEFPITYGIGEGGLSPNTSKQRKAQALQLKGYLLFYDQLLSAYLKQLSHVRDIFSMRPDTNRSPAERRTYFNQALENVPDVAQLIPTFLAENSPSQGTVLASIVEVSVLRQLPILEQHPHLELEANVAQFEGLHQQKLAMSQWQRIFRQGQFDSYFGEDNCGHFFILQSSMSQDVLLSQQRFDNKQTAQAAIENLAFIGTLEQVYRPITAKKMPFNYTFELVFSDYNYYDFLQQLLENEDQYCKRRNAFLDHLLARFSENFTDYAMLLYGTNEASPASKNAKARFLSHYPDLSRNRSKAFNYQKTIWNSDNVSGLEKRLKAIADIPNWGRQRLCNFDVIKLGQEFVYELKDTDNNLLLQSLEHYASQETAEQAVQTLETAMKQADSYQKEDAAAAHTYRFSVTHDKGTAIHPTTYATENERDIKIKDTFDLFREHVLEEDIFVFQHEYNLALLDQQEQTFGEAVQGFPSQELADENIATFIENIQNTTSAELVMIAADKNKYLDIQELKKQVNVHPIRYRWQLKNEEDIEIIHSFLDVENTAAAATDFAQLLTLPSEQVTILTQDLHLFLKAGTIILAKASFKTAEVLVEAQQNLENIIASVRTHQALIRPISNVLSWTVLDEDENLLLESHYLFRNQRLAEQDWREAAHASTDAKHIVLISKEDSTFQIQLQDSTGQILGQSPDFVENPEAQIAAIQAAFQLETDTRFKEQETGFAYQIIGQDKQILLESHRLFATASLALQARNEMLKNGFLSKNFFPSDDKPNLNYSFYLQDDQDKTIAFHPPTYGSEEERDQALRLSIAALQAYQSPLHFIEEYTAFFKKNESYPLLNAVQTFSTATVAKEDFINQLTLLSQESNFEPFDLQDNIFTFGVQGSSQLFATAAATYDTKTARKEAIDEIVETFKTATYRIKISQYESHWKFKYLTKRTATGAHPWFESSEIFSHPDEAKTAWLQLVEQIPNLEVSPQNANNERFSFGLSKRSDGLLLAQHPVSFDTEEAMLHEKNRAEKLRAYIENMHSSTDFNDNFCTVEKTPDSQEGDLVYRLLKTDEPLAYQPYSKQIDTDDLQIDIRADFNYLQLSFEENCIIEQEEGFRFVLRDANNQQIYFTSHQIFEDSAAAHLAFIEQYLIILQAAAKATHYFSDASNDGLFNIYEHIKTTENGTTSVGLPLAFVKINDFPDFSIIAISTIARSYPIRCTFQKEIDICQPKTPQVPRKYCFQLWSDGEQLIWNSSHCYDTVEAAQKDFDLFLLLLPHRINHAPHFDMEGRLMCPNQVEIYNETNENQEPLYLSDCLCEQEELSEVCHYYMSITEPLLLGQRFGDLKEIWGYQEPLSDLTCKQQSVTPKSDATGIALLLETAQEETAFYPFRDETRGYAHCFHLVKKDYRVGHFKQVFNTSSERNEALINLFNAYQIILQTSEEIENNPTETINIDSIKQDWNFNKNYTDKDLIELLKQFSNYQGILKQHCGLFAIELVNPEHILATSARCYDTLGELETAIEQTKACVNNEGMHLVEHILLRPKDCFESTCLFPVPSECGCNLQVEPLQEEDCSPIIEESENAICDTNLGELKDQEEGLEQYISGADPYSFWATLVLPAWTKRFRQANFRDFFFQLLYEQAPAHIAFNVVWVSPWQMCEFEKIYKKWLQTLAGKKACEQDIDDLNCQLLDCILALQNCPPDEIEIDLPATSPCAINEELDDSSLDISVHSSIQLHCLFTGKDKVFSEEEPPFMETFSPPKNVPTPNTTDSDSSTENGSPEETNTITETIKEEAISTVVTIEDNTFELSNIIDTATSIATVLSGFSFLETTSRSIDSPIESEPEEVKTLATVPQKNIPKSLSSKELSQKIRQRAAAYLKNIQAIEAEKIFKTASYKRTEFFLSTDGNFREYQELVTHISRYSLNRKGGVSDVHYFNLLYQATAYYLDKQVEQHPNEVQHLEDFTALFQLLLEKGMNKKQVIKTWNPTALKVWFGARIIDNYLSHLIPS